MSDPVVLHVIRPYPNADEYLKQEAWTMDARAMLLIGEAELPVGTPVTFDVTLGDGSRPIRAEGKVLANVEPTGARPGGLRVRFKRYGASTKTFLDRALEVAERPSLRPSPSVAPAAAPAPSPAPTPAEAEPVAVSASPPPHPPPPSPSPRSQAPSPEPAEPAPAVLVAAGAPAASESRAALLGLLDGLRARTVAERELPAPPERELLLERLRQRGQSEDATTRFRV